MKNRHILADDNINKLLVKLSIPAMTGMLVMALYNIIDTIFVARGVGTVGIAGLSIAFPLQMIILALGQMFGIGAASVISRSLGEKNILKAEKVMASIFLFGLIISISISIFGMIFIDKILYFFGSTETIFYSAKDYLRVILYGNAFFIFSMTANNILRSEGKAKVAMLTMITGAGLNILLDPLFIFVFKLGVGGAAWATVLSQFFATLYAFLALTSKKNSLRLNIKALCLDFHIIKEVMAIGFSSFIRHIAGSVSFIIINKTLGFYSGDVAIAVYGVVNRFLRFIFMPVFGIGQGLQPIVGFNYGAKNFDKVIRVTKSAIIASSMIMILGFGVVQLFPSAILRIFSKDQELITLGTHAIRIMMLLSPTVGFQIIIATLYQALGKAFPALILSMSREIFILIPLLLILPSYWYSDGVWASMPLSDFLSFLISLVFGFFIIKELKRKHNFVIKKSSD